jgi:hypothetical protein
LVLGHRSPVPVRSRSASVAPAGASNSAARRRRRCRSRCTPSEGRRTEQGRHWASGRRRAPRRDGTANSSRKASARRWLSYCPAGIGNDGGSRLRNHDEAVESLCFLAAAKRLRFPTACVSRRQYRNYLGIRRGPRAWAQASGQLGRDGGVTAPILLDEELGFGAVPVPHQVGIHATPSPFSNQRANGFE